MNLQKFYMGEAFDAYEYFGAHPDDDGVVFRTYAPNAHKISIVGQFNNWMEEPMKQLHQSGVWIGFSKEAKVGQMYKYVIYGSNGRVEHCDPYGFGMEIRPGACSIIRNLSEFQFTDNKWMKRRTRCYDQPLNIYNKCVFAYTRTDGKKNLLALFNFSDKEAVIAPELDGKVTMILNTDWKEFHGQTDKSLKKSIPQTLPPFTGLLFHYRKH